MDYCAVGSIKDLITLTLEPLEERHIVEVCVGVLKGLAYLHGQKIIHLDVKVRLYYRSLLTLFRLRILC
jgi:serine/threonine protein kinase